MSVLEGEGNGIGGSVEGLEVALVADVTDGVADVGDAAPEALPSFQLVARQQRHQFEHDTLQRVVSPNQSTHSFFSFFFSIEKYANEQ